VTGLPSGWGQGSESEFMDSSANAEVFPRNCRS
jgi:hypothetical protein